MERGCLVPAFDNCRHSIPRGLVIRAEVWQEEQQTEPYVEQLGLQTLQQRVYEQYLRPIHEDCPELYRMPPQRFTSARKRLCAGAQPRSQNPSIPRAQRPLQVAERFPSAGKFHRGASGHFEFYHSAEAGNGNSRTTVRHDYLALAHQRGTPTSAQVYGRLC